MYTLAMSLEELAALAGCGKRPILNGICNPHYAESIAEAI
jgi:hypothetical protein